MPKKILVVDDDVELNKMLHLTLQRKGFEVQSVTSGPDALRAAYEYHPDIIILDIMMPDMDGWQVCERLREISDVPIIMLTAKVEEDSVVQGFLLGADDYVKKPFSVKELELRIRAVLKRAQMKEHRASPMLYEDEQLRIDLEQRKVFRDGRMIHLTPTEFKLLSYLVRHKGEVIVHEELLKEVWGPAYTDATSSLSLYIRYLREKLEREPGDPRYIRTEWGVGYWFAPADGRV
jgi:two-component system KDP operon response regulator KdpE